MAKRGRKQAKWVREVRVGRDKVTLIVDARDPRETDEAAFENAWRVSGDLHVIADRLAMCRMRNEPPPEWVHKALLELADTSVDIKPYAKAARSLVRYVAVREAHDQGGTWEDAKVTAAETLRGQPAEASPDRMWAEYRKVRKALRAAGVRDDDSGYRSIDLPDKTSK
jgi:hypothetical protein